jgi:predicted PurR-regulated permease PerM
VRAEGQFVTIEIDAPATRHERGLDPRGPLARGFDAAAAKGWRLLVLMAVATAVVWVLARLYLVTVPLLVALVLSTLFVPLARWLARRGVPGTLAAVIAVVGGALIGLAVLTFVITLFV